MTAPKFLCTCHGLSAGDFERACAAGAHNVKTCFQHNGKLPKCGDCAPLVRKVLAESLGQRFTGAVEMAPFQSKPS